MAGGRALSPEQVLENDTMRGAVAGITLVPAVPSIVVDSPAASSGMLEGWDVNSTSNLTMQFASSISRSYNSAQSLSSLGWAGGAVDGANSTALALAASTYGGGSIAFVDGPGTSPYTLHPAGSRLYAPSADDDRSMSHFIGSAHVATFLEAGMGFVDPARIVSGNGSVLMTSIPSSAVPPGRYVVLVSAIGSGGIESALSVARAVPDMVALESTIGTG